MDGLERFTFEGDVEQLAAVETLEENAAGVEAQFHGLEPDGQFHERVGLHRMRPHVLVGHAERPVYLFNAKLNKQSNKLKLGRQ